MEEGWCVRPVLIEAVISDGDGCAIHVEQETPPQDIIVSAAQDRQNLLGLLSEQAPKVNLENQGEKPTKHHEKPKQHTPFCLDYRTGVLESGLSADAELRERKGGWLVGNWPWGSGFQSPGTGFVRWDQHPRDGVGNENYDKGDDDQQGSSNPRQTLSWRNTKGQQMPAQSCRWLPATRRVTVRSSRTTWL